MSPASPLARPTTLIEEMLRDDDYAQRHGRVPLALTHLEPPELERHITETCDGPRNDFAGYFADGLNDMVMADRPKMNQLVRKLLLGTITVEEQARFNELAVRAMLQHGTREVRAALEQSSVGHEVAVALLRARGEA